jgi:glycerate kinase
MARKRDSPVNRSRVVDGWLQHLGDLLEQATGRAVADQPGAGAAGGLGAGLLAFTNAKVYRGIEEILRMVHLDEALAQADLVITGEGRMDAQSLNGKAPIGIAKAAKQYGLPVVALVGARSDDLGPVYQAGIDAVWAIMNHPQTLTEAIQTVQTNLTTAGETAVRAFLMTQTKGD